AQHAGGHAKQRAERRQGQRHRPLSLPEQPSHHTLPVSKLLYVLLQQLPAPLASEPDHELGKRHHSQE
ncbi:hypothetical protein E2I00_007572, partial [Balaenoptera physalus]